MKTFLSLMAATLAAAISRAAKHKTRDSLVPGLHI